MTKVRLRHATQSRPGVQERRAVGVDARWRLGNGAMQTAAAAAAGVCMGDLGVRRLWRNCQCRTRLVAGVGSARVGRQESRAGHGYDGGQGCEVVGGEEEGAIC